jgi:RimJ/RimL family protein N-acetyltransferase
MTPEDIRAALIKNGINNLKEFGYPDVTPENLLTDMVYSNFFLKMLREIKGHKPEIDTEIVGFGYFSEFRFREAYKFTAEHSVYAHKNYIGKGIGKLLMTELIETATTQNLHTMIGVIDSENTNSIDFHKKFGFEEVGFIKESGYKFDRWLHSVIVQKML